MNDLEKKSIECLKNMPIEETTYQVARNVVLDYITNLQEENEKLKGVYYDPEEKNNNWTIEESELVKAFRERKDYKSRINKAIEFNQIVLDSDYVYSQDEIAQKNLNILQGEDKDE